MAELDFKDLGAHLPVIATAVASLAVIVGTVLKGYSWLTDSWRSSVRDEVKGLNKDIERIEKRIDRLEEKIENNGWGSSIRGERHRIPD